MTQALKMGRKTLTMAVVLTTLAWSMMATVLVAPMKASAAGCTSGSLIKGSLSAVYYCGADGKRYVFPNEKTYKSWYSDFSGVMTISDSDLATLQIGGNVTYRPGVKMIKITTDPKVYAVSKGGVLRPIASEAVASALYGSTWNKMIDDVSDAFFTNYSVGSAVNSTADFDKNAEMSADQSINVDKSIGGSSFGTVSASIASDSPMAKTLPKGSMGVNFLKFNLRNNGSSDAVVTNVTLQRQGPGAVADLANVYLYEGATRLTTGRTVNTSTNQVNFTGVNLTLAGGQTRTLWVAVDIATGALPSDVHNFQVLNIQLGSDTVGGLPITGSSMTISGASVGSVTVAKIGSITNPKVGQANVQVAQFSVAAGGVEDVWLNRITLFQGGNLAASNLTNLKLVQAGNTVATASSIDSKLHAVFNLASPMLIEKGATKNFEVWADIGGGARAGDNIKLSVEENDDVYAIGSTFGQGVQVVRTTYDGDSCTNSAGDCSYSAVEGGQVTISFNGPSSANLPSNGKDREVFNFTLASQANVEVKKLTLIITCSPGTTLGGCYSDAGLTIPNYTDVKISDTATGQVWWGPLDLSGGTDTSVTLAFTDVQDLAAASTHTFKVTTDIKSTVPANDALTVTLAAFGTSDLRNLDNNTFITPSTDVVPTGNIAGNQHTIVAPSLVMSLASTPVSQSFVKGSTSVPFVGVNLKAGDGANITVNSMTFTGYMDDDGTANAMTQGFDSQNNVAVSDDIQSCKLLDGTTQLGDAKSPTSSAAEGTGGLLQFTNLHLTVAAAATKTLTIKCDISNSAFRNSDGENIGFTIAAAGDVSAQDPDANALVAGTNLTGTPNAVSGGVTPVRVTVTNAGTVTVQLAPDDSESQAGLVVAGAQSAVLGKWRFTAASEELKLVKLTTFLDVLASNRSITSLSLYDENATLLAGPVAMTTGSTSATAVFSGMALVIPKDGSKTVTLKASLNTISGGAVSGDDLKMRIFIPGCTLAGCVGIDTTSFEVRGTSSSTVIRNFTGTTNTVTAGNSKLVRKTIPTVSLASLPTTVLTVGGGVVASRFTITADSNENVSLKKVAFKVSLNTSAGTVSSPAIREVGQGSDISASGTVQVDNGSTTCGFSSIGAVSPACVTVVFNSEQTIAAGTSKTYELRLTTTGFGSASDSMSTILLGDGVDANGALTGSLVATFPGADLGIAGTPRNFVWSDNSAVPHNDTVGGSTDWKDGFLVKVLPADAQTLSKS